MMALAARGLVERAEATRSAHGMVSQALGIDILQGRLPPDEVLPSEDELMRRFRVSRTALREALKTLAAKGMIQPKTRVGTRVLPPSHWHMFDPDLIAWRLQSGLDENVGFAARFYRAVATFLSDRVRTATATQEGIDADAADELDDAVLDNVDRAGARFNDLSRRLLDG